MKSGRKLVRSMLLSIIGFGSAAALGIYHQGVRSGEAYHRFYRFPDSRVRPIIIRYGEDGFFHRLVSPHTVSGTIGLTNAGGPVRIKMRMTAVPGDLTVDWENSNTGAFDLEKRTINRIVERGESVSVHHTFHVGESLRGKRRIFSGGLEVLDAVTGARLLTIPIRIVNPKGDRSAEMEGSRHEI